MVEVTIVWANGTSTSTVDFDKRDSEGYRARPIEESRAAAKEQFEQWAPTPQETAHDH